MSKNLGHSNIHFRDKRGNQQQATLSVKHAEMTVCPPIGKQKKYPKQKLSIIFAEEKTRPKGAPLSPGSWPLTFPLPITPTQCKSLFGIHGVGTSRPSSRP
ncbi:hypothetical protein [Halomonas sp. TG39a]|uniref:hypothetical protein n=1 Tax=Halomonas sp. TG39a TaxID=1415755 RepID=UPI0012697908|nr:hypothetical protein [Halomonas sp. TG39a]